jgi:signal transduction histidine kinase
MPRWLRATQWQLALLFTIAVVLSHMISLWLVYNHNTTLQTAIDRRLLLESTTNSVKLLNLIAPEQRELAIRAINNTDRAVLLADGPWRTKPDFYLAELQQRFADIMEVPLERILVTSRVSSRAYCRHEKEASPQEQFTPELCESNLYVSTQLDDKVWLNFYFNLGPPSSVLIERVMPTIIMTLVSVIIITSLTLRRITNPLKSLSQAANKFSRGELSRVTPSGPDDVKQTILAFNNMQEKLNLYIKDRLFLMAAVSHDLHTPITTMRLRIELLPESEDKEKLLETLSDMEMITQASLEFVRESNIDEDNKEIDISALLGSICDDLLESGLKVEYIQHERCTYFCRGKALKRAFTNLINNAVTYGCEAKVTLTVKADELQIAICDKGEGIPEDMHERIFEPFVRLENSRNRKTGGTGLGMSIARTIVRHHGGDIKLMNQPEGFTVLVVLPMV